MHGHKRQASGRMAIRYASRRAVCRACPLRGRCLAKKGTRREIERWVHEDVIDPHRARMREKGAVYLFESVRKHKYTDRGVRKMLARYAAQAGITRSMSPHKWRHFLFTWLKKEGIDDALIQPYSGHATRQSLEIYSRLSLTDVQASYDQAMKQFPIQ